MIRAALIAIVVLIIACAVLWVDNGRLRNTIEADRLAQKAMLLRIEQQRDSAMRDAVQFRQWYGIMEVEYDSLRAAYLRSEVFTDAITQRPHPRPPRGAAELRASMLRSIGR